MSTVHEFTDIVVAELRALAVDHTRQLVKGPAANHERLAGRILAYEETIDLIKARVKRWSTHDHDQEDQD